MSLKKYQNRGLNEIAQDYEYLLSLFKKMLSSIGEEEVQAALQASGIRTETEVPHGEKLTQAIGICFELMNITEENAANSYRREVEIDFGDEAMRDSSLKLLNTLQIEALRSWRELPVNDERKEQKLPEMLLLVNAISGGLQSTG